jgi:hypothetical protein
MAHLEKRMRNNCVETWARVFVYQHLTDEFLQVVWNIVFVLCKVGPCVLAFRDVEENLCGLGRT